MSNPASSAEAMDPRAFLGVGAALGLGVLWAIGHLPGEWFAALAIGFLFLFLLLLSGRIERVLFGLLFLIIPVNPDFHIETARYTADPLITHGSSPLMGFSCMDIILAALYLLWVGRLLTARGTFRILWPAGATLLLALIGWGALSMLNAEDPVLSLFMLGWFAKAFLLFFYLANHLRTGEDFWLAARMLMAGLVLEGLIACAQYAAGDNFGLQVLGERAVRKEVELGASTIFRVGGTLGHPNALGGYFASVLPMLLALRFVPLPRLWRLVALGSLGLGSIALVLTLSRSAWLAAALTCGGVMVWLFRYARRRVRWAPILGAMLVLVVALSAFAPLIAARWLEDDQGSTLSRLPQTQIALEMIREHPFLGVGLNNYSRVQHLYDTYVEAPNRLRRVYVHEVRLHNIFMLLVAEIGLASLLFLGGFLWAVAGRARRLLGALRGDLRTQMIVLGAGMGLVARILHDAAHTGHLSMSTFIWVFAAMLVARPGVAQRAVSVPSAGIGHPVPHKERAAA